MFEIIGHRGASFDAPENTLAAIQLAWEQQADGVEIDIRLTADNQIVVIHDATTGRVSKKDIEISKSTLNQIKEVEIKKEKANIPTLHEVIKILPLDKTLFIEFKCGIKAINVLRDVLQFNNRFNNCRIISFDLKTLKEVKNYIPNVDLYWLQGVEELDDYLISWSLEKCREEQFNGLMVTSFVVNPNLIEIFHKENLKLYAWTINSANTASKFAKWGLDGIITDRPGWIREQFKLLV